MALSRTIEPQREIHKYPDFVLSGIDRHSAIELWEPWTIADSGPSRNCKSATQCLRRLLMALFYRADPSDEFSLLGGKLDVPLTSRKRRK